MSDFIHSLDSSILLYIQNIIRNPILDPVIMLFSISGNFGILWLTIAGMLIVTKKHRRAGITLLACLSLCFVINNIVLKNLFQRVRPYNVVPGLIAFTGRFADSASWSFPSGHACSSFAAAFALSFSFGKKGMLFYLPAVLIALSRAYIGVHYPSDIICGAIVGTLGAFALCTLIRLTPKKKL